LDRMILLRCRDGRGILHHTSIGVPGKKRRRGLPVHYLLLLKIPLAVEGKPSTASSRPRQGTSTYSREAAGSFSAARICSWRPPVEGNRAALKSPVRRHQGERRPQRRSSGARLAVTDLHAARPPPAETRFKMWWHLVGAAIEHAATMHAQHVAGLAVDRNAACPPKEISFRKLFLDGEADEEQTSSLATVLDVLRTKWPDGCQARDIAAYAGAADERGIEFKAALEQASGKAIKVVTASTITWRLKALLDAPVQFEAGVFVLRYLSDHDAGTFTVKKVAAG
jgi:hypothetical protein